MKSFIEDWICENNVFINSNLFSFLEEEQLKQRIQRVIIFNISDNTWINWNDLN